VLFFVRDRLQAPEWAGALLLAYFLAAGAAVPLWTRIARRLGLVRTWLLAMVLACTAFVWAAGLGAGDVVAFLLVCVISGTALGADLVVPAALLTGVVQRAGHDRAHEGRYVGWWSALTKLNLALAAGLALPLLDLAGYTPGTRSPQALTALALAYAGLPCAIKLLAAAAVWRWRAHWETPALRRPELAPKEAACP
jgi:Na+/melibiose symporter-like transporter